MTTIVSGWTGRKYDILGDQFCRTLDKFWPRGSSAWPEPDVQAAIYIDGNGELPPLPAARGVIRLLRQCKGLAEFQERHKEHPYAHGRQPGPEWKEKDRLLGYSWRHDAAKFATQLFIPEEASQHLPDGEILVWFDIDVAFTAPVPKGIVEALIGNADCAYLGRPPKHSELGFWAVRLSPVTRDFLTYLTVLYATDGVFELQQWHSAFVWDHARETFEKHQGMSSKNITPNGNGHVWPRSPLQGFSSHLKGARKASLLVNV